MRIPFSILAIALVPACAADGSDGSDSVMQQGAGKYETVHSIGIGPDNGTVVGGTFWEETDVGTGTLVAGGQEDGFVASYAADWTPRWSRTIGGADLDRDDFISDVFVDADGRVTVSGYAEGAVDLGGGSSTHVGGSAFVAQYADDGAYRWSAWFSEEFDGSHPRATALDADGEVLFVYDGPGALMPINGETWLVRFSPDGEVLARQELSVFEDGAVPFWYSISDIAIAPGGDIVMLGTFDLDDGGNTDRHYFLERRAADGTLRWRKDRDGGSWASHSLAVTADGKILVGGATVRRFSSAGDLIGELAVVDPAPADEPDIGGHIAVASDGQIVATGAHAVKAFTPDGTPSWTVDLDGNDAVVTALAVHGEDVTFAGTFIGSLQVLDAELESHPSVGYDGSRQDFFVARVGGGDIAAASEGE